MNTNERLLNDLFGYLNAHDHNSMATCYSEAASFQDIAFRLTNKQQIHAMWHMICSESENGRKSDIVATVKEMVIDDTSGRVVVIDDYTFRDTGRKVRNQIVSDFAFRDGKITSQHDKCDPVSWGRQAFGGVKGFVVGHVDFIRRGKAMKKLRTLYPNAFHG